MENFLASRFKNTASTPFSDSEKDAMVKDIINLGIGDHDIVTDESITNAAAEDAKKGHTKYTDPMGDKELIAEICKYYNDNYDAQIEKDQVYIVPGACHGLYVALMSLLDQGDEIIVPDPYFAPYKEQIELSGGKLVPMPTYEENDFRLDPKALEKYITDKTKGIMINYPNNPTGACISRDKLSEVLEIGKKYKKIILSDEVYGIYSYNEEYTPMLYLDKKSEHSITLGSFSKWFAMTGWRVGYIIAPKYIIDCIMNINDNICYTASSVSERGALYALRNRAGLEKMLYDEYYKRINYAYNRINSIDKLSVKVKDGSIYLFMNIKGTGMTSAEFAAFLKKKGIIVIPGTCFGEAGEGYVRIACTHTVEVLKKAFDRIEEAVGELKA